MQWSEIRVGVSKSTKAAISNRLWEVGALGVYEQDEGGDIYLTGYFKGSADTAKDELLLFLEDLSLMEGFHWDGILEYREIQDQDWVSEYKKFYKAQPLSKQFFLRPAWEEIEIPKEMIPIVMEPGQAFGTGLHATTQLCIQRLEELPPEVIHPGAEVIDVGTGTGILAMVAYHLGVRKIWAMDIDIKAEQAARENFIQNHCEGIELATTTLDTCQRQFDFIISNILLEAHRILKPEYTRVLRSGGRLLLSGLLVEQKEEVESLFAVPDFEKTFEKTQGEWLSLEYQKK